MNTFIRYANQNKRQPTKNVTKNYLNVKSVLNIIPAKVCTNKVSEENCLFHRQIENTFKSNL